MPIIARETIKEKRSYEEGERVERVPLNYQSGLALNSKNNAVFFKLEVKVADDLRKRINEKRLPELLNTHCSSETQLIYFLCV